MEVDPAFAFDAEQIRICVHLYMNRHNIHYCTADTPPRMVCPIDIARCYFIFHH